MKQWQKILAVLAASAGLGLMTTASPLASAADAPKLAVAMAKKEAAKDIVLKGDAKCTSCHDEADGPQLLAIGKTKHGTNADERTPTCTKCHGDSEKHLQHKGSDKPPKPDLTFGKNTMTPASERSGACLTCHKKDPTRSHWAGSTHETKDVACSSCHQVHAAKDKARDKQTQTEVCFSCHKEQRAMFNRPSRHPIQEGKVSCSDCHNPHGSVAAKLLKRNNTNETCYQCHMEKRGPFVHNHEPVGEDCGNCHNPHGTTAEFMLKVRVPFLCHQCHTPHGGFIPGLTGAQVPGLVAGVGGAGKSGVNVNQGRACMNCHTQVHGSNNPAATNPTPQFMLR